MYLCLDDVRSLSQIYGYTKNFLYNDTHNWQIVRNYNDFVAFIEKLYIDTGGLPDLISFDHDLGETAYKDWHENHVEWEAGTKQIDYSSPKEKTGYHCAQWLVEFCYKNCLSMPQYLCHSMNVPGKVNILTVLSNFDKQTL